MYRIINRDATETLENTIENNALQWEDRDIFVVVDSSTTMGIIYMKVAVASNQSLGTTTVCVVTTLYM